MFQVSTLHVFVNFGGRQANSLQEQRVSKISRPLMDTFILLFARLARPLGSYMMIVSGFNRFKKCWMSRYCLKRAYVNSSL